MSWRDKAAPIITEQIKQAKEQNLSLKEAKKLISVAYPFGQRAYHPYKIWLSEVKRQLAEAFDIPRPPRPKVKLEMNRATNWQQKLL